MTNSIHSTVKLFAVFLVAASLASLSGAISSNFYLPSIHPASAVDDRVCPVLLPGGGCSDYWVPAGPAEDTFAATIFSDEQAEFSDLQSATPHVDFSDWPLTPDLTGPFTTSPNFIITSSVRQAGYFELQFLLANNFWGCDFNFGNSACGVHVRQGIAHMIDTAVFSAKEPSLAGQAVAIDTPNPSDNVGSLPAANPCAWDTLFQQSGASCIVGAPGGTAYHLGAAAGANGIAWLQAPGSKDLNAAAAHFVAAGIATGCDGGTGIASCIASTDSRLSGISAIASQHVPNIFITHDNQPRLHLGDSYSEQICYIFTGSYNVPCPYSSTACGLCGVFPGFFTSKTSVSLSWGMYTSAYQSTTGPQPFDQSFYFHYNSRFASGIPSIQPPNGQCSPSSVPTASASDYTYLCNPSYDSVTNQLEFAPCIMATGDPVVGSTSNNSTGTCSGTAKLSSIGAGVEAEDLFGKNAFTIPVFEQNAQFGLLNNGYIRHINNIGAGLPNYFTWLDSWNPSPTLPGTIRQGFKQTTTSVNPFLSRTPWDDYMVGNVYDTLAATNPLVGGQLFDWMTLSISPVSNLSMTYTPPPKTVSTFRFTLRSDIFFQDGQKVTSFDVAFSYLALKGAGAFVSGGASPMTGVTILGPSQFDINVNAVGVFTLLSLTGLPILPGSYWTNAGSSTWKSAVSACSMTGAACYPAQYTLDSSTPTLTNCNLACVFPASDMNLNVGQTSAYFDPIASHVLVGSGAWQCGIGPTLGSGCSSSGMENPPVGGGYTLTRFGKGLAPASSVTSIYFRSNGNLAVYLWSLNTGDITKDFLNFSVVASCFGAPVTSAAPCAHFQQGIGGNNPSGQPQPVGLSQVSIVNRFIGVNWVGPYSWVSNPPLGIIPLDPVLYEGPTTISPGTGAFGIGCPLGYDC